MAVVGKVLVVGGGIAGMSFAIRMRAAGMAVDLVDLDPEWRSVGAGITMNGASLRALQTVGVLDRIKQEAYVSDGLVMCAADGTPVFRSPTDRLFGPDIPNTSGILRPVLHTILSEATRAAGVAVRLGVTLERFDEDAAGVDAVFTDGSTARYDIVVGADGAHSVLRTMLFPDAPIGRYSGQGCWRALTPRPPEVTNAHIYTAPLKAGFNPVNQAQMYMFLLEHDPDKGWKDMSNAVELLREQMRGFGGHMEAIAAGLGPESQINYRPLEPVILPAPWHKGRAVLIGDAAHSTTPHLAYGAGMAVEDAVVLAEELADKDTVAAAFAGYMDRRYERCKLLVETSIQLGELEMAHAPLGESAKIMMDIQKVLCEPI